MSGDNEQFYEIMDMQRQRKKHMFEWMLSAHRRRYGAGKQLNSINHKKKLVG